MKILQKNVINAFSVAVKEVFDTMIHMEVEEVSEVPEYADDKDVIISNIIIKQELFTGVCQVICSRELAQEIATQMTGIDFEPFEPIVDDTVGELINMFLGFTKSQLSRTEEYFEIAPPFLISGKGIKITTKRGSSVFEKSYSIEGEFLKLKIIYS